jgi:heme-degrading monooxygenase HmoA
MIITLFRSRLTSQARDDYSAMATEILERASTYPGFIAMKEFKADDGERLTVVWWENHELQAAWRRDERHLVAQRLGRERWYHDYHIEVAEVKSLTSPHGDASVTCAVHRPSAFLPSTMS